MDVGRYVEAKATCESVSRDYADSEWLPSYAKWLLIGVMCEDRSDPSITLGLVAEMRQDPVHDDIGYQCQLSLWESCIRVAKGDNAGAEQLLTGIVAKPPNDYGIVMEAYYHRACLRIVLGRFDEAKADIEKIGKPRVYLRYLALGDWHYYQDNYAEAAKNYEEALTRMPRIRTPNSEPLRAFKRLAMSYSRLGSKDQEAATRQKLADFEAAHK